MCSSHSVYLIKKKKTNQGSKRLKTHFLFAYCKEQFGEQTTLPRPDVVGLDEIKSKRDHYRLSLISHFGI